MPEYEFRAEDGRGVRITFPRPLKADELSKLRAARAKAWDLEPAKVNAKAVDRLEQKGTFPGDMPWSDTVRQWGKDRPGFLGDLVRGVIPMTPAQTGADVATLPLSGLKAGRMVGGAVRAGAAAAGAASGEALAGGDSPGQSAILHGIPTALMESALGMAERVAGPRIGAMWRHGTPNPREAGRLERKGVEQGRRAAEKTASDQTRALEEQAAERAKTQTAQAKEGAQATRDAAEKMRVGTRQKDIAHGMSRVIPELEADAQELYGAAFSWGKPQLDRVFDSAIAGVNQRLGGWKFRIPELKGGAPLTFDEARTELAELGSSIGQQGRTVRSSTQAYNAVDYRNARDELQAQLNNADQHLHPMHRFLPNVAWAGDVWDDAMKSRAAGRTYLGLLQKAIDPKTGALDPDKMRTLVNKNVEKLRERFGRAWDQAESALLGGERVPAQVSGPLKTPSVAPVKPAPVTPVQPQYPPARAPFQFSPATTAAADVAAQDPLIGGAEMGIAKEIPSTLYRFGHRLLAP